jgi:DNA-binding beta-propeller fold protein YncE
MKAAVLSLTAALAALLAAGAECRVTAADPAAPLKPIGSVPLPGIEGDFDHFAVDLKGNRLFLAAEDHHSVEVFDLHTGKPLRSIAGFDTPHSVLYLPETDRLFVVDGGMGGSCQIVDGTSYKVLKSIKLSADADALAYDAASHLLYVGNGGKEAGNDYSLISVIDTARGEKVADIKVASTNLEAMALEKGGSLLYVNIRDKNQIGVIDRKTRTLVATWQLQRVTHNTPMVLDEANHRLLIAGRKPGVFGVVDTSSGKEIAALPAPDGVDDMSFDPQSKLIYLACGEGFVSVYRQIDADHYAALGRVPTGYRGKIGVLVPQLQRYYVATVTKDNMPAQLLMFEVAK